MHTWKLTVAVLCMAAATSAADRGEFTIRTTQQGRRVAFWTGTTPPTPEALRALVRRHVRAAGTHRDGDTIAAQAIDAIALDSLGDVRFAKNSSLLTERSARELRRTCEAFTQDDELRRIRFRLVGHSCVLGPPALNDRLSLRRARSVAGFLAQCLGGGERVAGVEGLGSRELLADAPPDSPLQRRVELVMVSPFDGPAPIP